MILNIRYKDSIGNSVGFTYTADIQKDLLPAYIQGIELGLWLSDPSNKLINIIDIETNEVFYAKNQEIQPRILDRQKENPNRCIQYDKGFL